MRALLDANIFISYLLSPKKDSPVVQVMEALFAAKFVLLLPSELHDEFSRALIKKPYLKKKITVGQVTKLVNSLSILAEAVPPITEKIPETARDPKDNYLPAYALVSEADYLVTGDDDLLTLKKVGQVQIINPREFVEILKKRR